MTEYLAIRNMMRCPSHPGALLADIIPATGRNKVEIASLIGISRQQLYDILNERKPVSPNVAARLGKLFGDGAIVWLRMQSAYDAWHAERDVDVSAIPTIRAAQVQRASPKHRKVEMDWVSGDVMNFNYQIVVRFFEVLIPTVIACFLAYIAWQQMQTSREKLKMDLFEKRFLIYQQFQKFIKIALAKRGVADTDLAEY